MYCSPWDRKESDTTEQLNQNDVVSSRTRDPTRVPCIGRQSLNHQTAREILREGFRATFGEELLLLFSRSFD